MPGSIAKGCGIGALGLALLGLAFCVAFTDASSQQTVEECLAKMRKPILAKTAILPNNAVLKAKHARIEHVLYGNEDDAKRVAKEFSERGWQTHVGPNDEIGWGATLFEDPARFRTEASERVRQLCLVAEENSLRYQSWWINAPGIADYVSQDGDPLNVVEEVLPE